MSHALGTHPSLESGPSPEQARALLANAREGTRRLVAAPSGFKARGFVEADWQWLVSLCDASVRDAYVNTIPEEGGMEGSIFTQERRATRSAADRWTQSLLDGFRDVAPSPGPSGG